ncbi:hypothetical protein C8R45DRAFT_985439 [Mycena sanguinolenta]|nr:hypothetical protein C8R45DRAFT_985439 [Mycena sanguinolenta]
MPSLGARCAMHSHNIRQITGNGETNEDGIANNFAGNNDGGTSFDTPDSSAFQNNIVEFTTPVSTSSVTTTTLTRSVLLPTVLSIPPPKYSVAPTAEKQQLSSGAIAGIAVIVFLVGITLVHIRQRRLHRRAKLFHAKLNGGLTIISPFMLLEEARNFGTARATRAQSDARSISASTIARQRLETELRAATEKMAELEELAQSSTTTISEPDASGGNESVGSGSAASPPPDLEAELRAAREQINVLIARMNALDAAWGMGMGGEPPPEYA